jgi:methylmalonyl-CoA mutase
VSYADWGADLIAALRDSGARYIILAGTPGPRTIPATSVDDSCARGVDAVAFLRRIRTELSR